MSPVPGVLPVAAPTQQSLSPSSESPVSAATTSSSSSSIRTTTATATITTNAVVSIERLSIPHNNNNTSSNNNNRKTIEISPSVKTASSGNTASCPIVKIEQAKCSDSNTKLTPSAVATVDKPRADGVSGVNAAKKSPSPNRSTASAVVPVSITATKTVTAITTAKPTTTSITNTTTTNHSNNNHNNNNNNNVNKNANNNDKISSSSSSNDKSSDNKKNSSASDLVSHCKPSTSSNDRSGTSTSSNCNSSSSSSTSNGGSSTVNGSNGGQRKDDYYDIRPNTESSTVKNAILSANSFDQAQRIQLKTINAHIVCNLCKGYLIDATTIVECLHTFCHSCIIEHLKTKQYCPECEMMINTAKPNIKSDTTLQAIVYKLVPGLYEKELLRKRAFYRDRPVEAMLATPEQRGEDTEHLIFGPSENMSLSLEYADIDCSEIDDVDIKGLKTPKYLQCPAIFTVAHLKKFVLYKFGIDTSYFYVEIMYKVKTIVLADHYTLMDVAYIYTWKRDAPMRFFFRVKEVENPPPRKPKLTRKLPNKQQEDGTNKSETIEGIEGGCKNPDEKDVIMEESRGEIKAIIKQEPFETVEVEEKVGKLNISGTATEVPVADSKSNGSSAITAESIKCHVKVERISNEKASPPPPTTASSEIFPVVRLPAPFEFTEDEKLEPKTEKLKITLVNRNKQSKDGVDEYITNKSKHESSTKSSKGSKKDSKHHHHHSGSQHKSPTENEERKVENIKLKIDLSKQNSVTIINMSGPECVKKEVVKPVKPEKEWKLKVKKEKEDKNYSPKSHNGHESSKKSKSPEEKTKFEIKPNPSANFKGHVVPPITIKKEERISPERKSPKATSQLCSPKPEEEPTRDKAEIDEETKKSEFLNSFALTPIKSAISPEKQGKNKAAGPSLLPSMPSLLPTQPIVQKVSIPPSAPIKASAASKRKSREPMKAIVKKPRCDSPQAPPIFVPHSKPPPTLKESPMDVASISFKLAPFPIGVAQTPAVSSDSNISLTKKQADEKLMPAPPPLKMLGTPKKPSVGKTPKTNKTTNKTQVNAKQQNQMSTTGGGYFIPSGIASSKTPIVPTPPGNRTPIARRYPPILPKSPRPNPFANLPGDVNNLLGNSGTEIKQIPNGDAKDIKVYGPAMDNSPKLPMGPPSSPQMVQGNKSNNRKAGKPQNPPNYLNYALLNASKSKMSEVPLGCRTPIYAPNSPIYTPNSPIYSPNSPQYMPNYNIPTQPTFKYTKPQSSVSNYLQNVLGQNKQMSSLFPAPPTKKPLDTTPSNTNKTSPGPDNKNDENLLKRPYPFAKSPSDTVDKIQEPPEKQAKVQSLLNSCKINIPSSLSITITNEESDSNSNSSSIAKHKSPVNNYIEILKLPDSQPVSTNDQKLGSSPVCDAKNQKSPMPKIGEMKVTMSNVLGANSKPKSSPTYVANHTGKALSSPTSKNGQNTSNSDQMKSMQMSGNQPNNSKSMEKSPTPPNPPRDNKKSPTPEKKDVNQVKPADKGQKKILQGLLDVKKSPESKEPGTPNKSPKDNENTAPATKKFRHILPRTDNTPKNPLVSPLSIPSLTGKAPKAKNGKAPNAKATNKKSPNQANSASAVGKKPPVSGVKSDPVLDLTGLPIMTSTPIKAPGSQRQPHSPNAPSLPAVTSSGPMGPAPQTPSDLANFLNESILRAHQQQQQANSGIYVPHLAAAASFNPHFASVNLGYNFQQAFIIDQFNRMQKAGQDALEKYMQKLKEGATKSGPTSPTAVSNASPSVTGLPSGPGMSPSSNGSTTADVKDVA